MRPTPVVIGLVTLREIGVAAGEADHFDVLSRIVSTGAGAPRDLGLQVQVAWTHPDQLPAR